MKEFEGKYIFLRPTGNNWKRTGGKHQYRRAKIIKVARVFVTFCFDGYPFEEKCRFEGNRLSNDHNGGYVAYQYKQDVENYYEAVELSRKIEESFRYGRNRTEADIYTLRKVAELLGIT